MNPTLYLCCLNVMNFIMPEAVFTKLKTFPGNSSLKVESIDRFHLERLIKERNNKPLLLNLWTTQNLSCQEEFSDLIKIKSAFSGVDVVGLSIDYKTEVETIIKPFLEEQKVNFVNYVNGCKKELELIDLLNEKWNGILPATFIYDTKGMLKSFAEGKKDYEFFRKELLKLNPNIN